MDRWGSGKRDGKQRRTKATFGRTMMQALELLWLAKGTSQDEAALISEILKPVSIVSIELHLSEGISKLVSKVVSQLVKNSDKKIKFHITWVDRFMFDLKIFLSFAMSMPNQVLGDILGQEIPNLMIHAIYGTTVLNDIVHWACSLSHF